MSETEPAATNDLPTPNWLSLYFIASALLFAGAGASHLYSFVTSREFSLFHAIFTLLDPLVAWLMIRRPLWLAYAFPVFVAQQIYAHGTLLAQSIRHGGFDFVSMFIVDFMPLTALLLFVDRARRIAPHA